MPDTTLKQTIVTDDSQTLAALQRIRQEYGALEAKMQEVVEGAKQGHATLSSALREQAQELGGLVTRYASVGFAVHEVIGAYSDWREHLREIGREQATLTNNIVANMARVGQAATGGGAHAQAQIKAIVDSGATTAQAQAAYFAGISTVSPLAVPRERAEAIAAEGAKDAARFAGDSGLLAQHVAGAVRMAEIVPGSAKAPYDILERLKTEVGAAKAPALASEEYMGAAKALVNAGMPFGEAAEMGALALQRDIPLGLLSQLASKANANRMPRPRHWGQRPKPEDLAYNRFAAADTPYAAIQMALSDPEVQEAVLGKKLEGRIGGKNPRLAFAEIQAGAARIAVPGGLDEARADQRKYEEGRKAIEDQRMARVEDSDRREHDAEARLQGAYWKWIEHLKNNSPVWTRGLNTANASIAEAVYGSYSSAAGGVAPFGKAEEYIQEFETRYAHLPYEERRREAQSRLRGMPHELAKWEAGNPAPPDPRPAQPDPQMTEQTELLRQVLSARGSDFDLALATFMQSIAGE